MKVAIVTPFHSEPVEQLAQCILSVARQEFYSSAKNFEHVLVSDGGEGPSLAVDAMRSIHLPTQQWPKVISLPRAHSDFGNCARAIGALDAVARGYDAVAFLDADNWIEPSHLAAMVKLHESSGAPICTASRMICRVNGTAMFVDKESDGQGHTDTSCLFLSREAFYLLPFWAFVPPSHAAVGDRVFWSMVRSSRLSCAHSSARTVNYRTRYAVHYRAIGEEPPPEAKEGAPYPIGLTFQEARLFVPGVP